MTYLFLNFLELLPRSAFSGIAQGQFPPRVLQLSAGTPHLKKNAALCFIDSDFGLLLPHSLLRILLLFAARVPRFPLQRQTNRPDVAGKNVFEM